MEVNRIVSPASADTTAPSPDAPLPLTTPQRVEFNWADVKGVYKNCRGIWAAQWTDERGQRHTKYFNPKFYASEATAKLEAYKFKVHIQREIELKGGVQKRRGVGPNTLPCTRRRTRRRGDFSKNDEATDVGKRISRRGITFAQPRPMYTHDFLAQRLGMAPNTSLIPLYTTMASPFPFGNATGDTSEGNHQDLMAVLQAMTSSGLRGDHLGVPGSLRSSDWHDWRSQSTEEVDKRQWEDTLGDNTSYAGPPSPKPSLNLNRSLESSQMNQSAVTTETYAVKFTPQMRSFKLFRSPMEVAPWTLSLRNEVVPTATADLTERTAHNIASQLALRVDSADISTSQREVVEDNPVIVPGALSSYWPYEPSWTHTGTMYVAYPEDIPNDAALQPCLIQPRPQDRSDRETGTESAEHEHDQLHINKRPRRNGV